MTASSAPTAASRGTSVGPPSVAANWPTAASIAAIWAGVRSGMRDPTRP